MLSPESISSSWGLCNPKVEDEKTYLIKRKKKNGWETDTRIHKSPRMKALQNVVLDVDLWRKAVVKHHSETG